MFKKRDVSVTLTVYKDCVLWCGTFAGVSRKCRSMGGHLVALLLRVSDCSPEVQIPAGCRDFPLSSDFTSQTPCLLSMP